MKSRTTDLGQALFSMVVVADTHLSEQDMQSNSPFAVNRLANGRMKHVVDDINAMAPDFVINLGDLIHPVPGVPNAYADAVARFLEQTEKLNCPQYLVPGNHDVGDKPIDWAPAGVVCDEYLDLWQKYFGEHFYAFEQSGCHFLVINASIINTGLAVEEAQRTWLETYFSENQGQRFFINIHYPPFLTDADEPEHYDNIADPGRSWLLSLMEQYEVEALFAGHVHNFWYNQQGNTDCYLLPSTAFVRQDYSEMYRVPPNESDEHGRNDEAKLGYMQVTVYEKGHVCHSIRTYGQLGGEQQVLPIDQRCAPIHPAEQIHAPLGFDLRQTWSEVLEIPPSGGLDEFIRKPVRNDYPLMAIWEMGIKKLRVPLHDLLDSYVRSRMQALQQHGHQFTVFSFGLLTESECRCLLKYQSLVESWELAYTDPDLPKITHQLKQLTEGRAAASGSDLNREDAQITSMQRPIYLSRLHTHDDVKQKGDRYFHVINHGFLLTEGEKMEQLLQQYGLQGVITGFVLRIDLAAEPWQSVLQASQLAEKMALRFSLHLRLAGENPAQANYDDSAIARRIAASLVAAKTQFLVDVFVDTFADNDRGYFVKNGVVDRLYNPRLASRVISHLYSVLNIRQPLQPLVRHEIIHGEVLMFHSEDTLYALVLPEQPIYLNQLNCRLKCGSLSANKLNAPACLIDLATGVKTSLISSISDTDLSCAGSDEQNEIEILIDNAQLYQSPSLICWSLS